MRLKLLIATSILFLSIQGFSENYFVKATEEDLANLIKSTRSYLSPKEEVYNNNYEYFLSPVKKGIEVITLKKEFDEKLYFYPEIIKGGNVYIGCFGKMKYDKTLKKLVPNFIERCAFELKSGNEVKLSKEESSSKDLYLDVLIKNKPKTLVDKFTLKVKSIPNKAYGEKDQVLAAYDSEDNLIWGIKTNKLFVLLGADSKNLYLGARGSCITCVNKETGAINWEKCLTTKSYGSALYVDFIIFNDSILLYGPSSALPIRQKTLRINYKNGKSFIFIDKHTGDIQKATVIYVNHFKPRLIFQDKIIFFKKNNTEIVIIK